MMYDMLFFVSTFISAISQIILKKSTQKKYKNIWKEYMNRNVVTAYGLFFLSSVITFVGYRYVALSKGVILEASGYVFVFLLSFFCLKESISVKKILAIIFIIMGIIIFNI